VGDPDGDDAMAEEVEELLRVSTARAAAAA